MPACCEFRGQNTCGGGTPPHTLFCSHLEVFVFFFLLPPPFSADYLNDLQGRSDDDSSGTWEFYGSSVCGEQLCVLLWSAGREWVGRILSEGWGGGHWAPEAGPSGERILLFRHRPPSVQFN